MHKIISSGSVSSETVLPAVRFCKKPMGGARDHRIIIQVVTDPGSGSLVIKLGASTTESPVGGYIFHTLETINTGADFISEVIPLAPDNVDITLTPTGGTWKVNIITTVEG